MRITTAAALIFCFALRAAAANAQWEPAKIVPTHAVLADVLAANARSAPGAAFDRRRERWTYAVRSQRIAVAVAVRDDDFRTTLDLSGLTYTAGRLAGVRWRADGNGVVHGLEADLQGDAADRAPQSLFRLDPASCTLAGETSSPLPAWVVAVRRDGDKAAFLYVDKTSGAIVQEVMRDGRRVVTTSFDRFEPLGSGLRARHWHIEDGNRANATDVTVDTIEPGEVTPADVAFPVRRVFAAAPALDSSPYLDATFDRGQVRLAMTIDGKQHRFILDTGTTSITVDPALAKRYGETTLEHAVLPHVAIGPLMLDPVSTLVVPFDGTGILGLDFFVGHVVEIDYLHERVRVLDAADAQRVFADPATTVITANVDEGLPLAAAALGDAGASAFALDTGSPHLYVMRPFVDRYAAVIGSRWTKTGGTFFENYLEGGIELQGYTAADFVFADWKIPNVALGAQIPSKHSDDLDIPFDGIIGTDVLRSFDLYFDYDNERLGLRR